MLLTRFLCPCNPLARKGLFRFEPCLPIYLEANLVRRLESLVVECQQGRFQFSFLLSFDLKSGYHHFDISQTIRYFWVFPGFPPVLLNIFALQFFLLILVRPLIFSPNSLDLLLSFEVLLVFNDSCVSRRPVRQGNIFLEKQYC